MTGAERPGRRRRPAAAALAVLLLAAGSVHAALDAWDPGDDTDPGATVLAPTLAPQVHGPHEIDWLAGDLEDWYRVYLNAGEVFHADSIGGTGDPFAILYADDAASMVGFDDNAGGGNQFSINYFVPVSGTYYLDVWGGAIGNVYDLNYWLVVPPLDAAGSGVPDTVLEGQPAQIVLTVTNTGPAAVTDLVPSALLFFGADSGTIVAGPVPPSIASLAPGAAAGFTWTVNMTAAGVAAWQLTVTAYDTGAATPTTSANFAAVAATTPDGWFQFGFPFALWHHPADAASPAGRVVSSPSPTAWWYGQDATGDYDTPGSANMAELSSPEFTVRPGQVLSFWSWEETENGVGFDVRDVEITTDGGGIWTPLQNLFGTEGTWYKVDIPLAAYAGQTAAFRFRFDTVDDVSNAFGGWWIDDVNVGPVFASVTVPSSPPVAGSWYDVVVTVTNTGTTDLTPFTLDLSVVQGTTLASYIAGPAPAVPGTLAAGAAASFTWTFSSAGQGFVEFSATAAGLDAVTGTAVWSAAVASYALCAPTLTAGVRAAAPEYVSGGEQQLWRLAFSNPGTRVMYNATFTTQAGSFNQRSYISPSYSATLTGGATVAASWALAVTGPWTPGEPPGGSNIFLRWVVPQLDPGRSGVIGWRTTTLSGPTLSLETYVTATLSCDPPGFDPGELAATATGTGRRIEPPLAWLRLHDGGPWGGDRYHAVAERGGTVYVAGAESRPDLGEGLNWVVRAFSPAGVMLWEDRYNGPADGDDEALGITVTPSLTGVVYVTGRESRTDIGEGDNLLIRAYSPDGALLWSDSYNSPANDDDVGHGVATDALGTVIWVAGTEARPDLAQGDDLVLLGWDAVGTLVSTGSYDAAGGDDEGLAVAVSEAGDRIVIAGSETRADLGEARNGRVFVLDGGGVGLVWTRTHNAPANADDAFRGVAIDALSGIVTVSGFEERPDMAQARNWLTKSFDRDGNQLWETTGNGPANGDDESAGIVVRGGIGSLLVSGYEDRTDAAQSDNWRWRLLDNAGNILDTGAQDGLVSGGDRLGGAAFSASAYAVAAGWEATRDTGDDAAVARSGLAPFRYPATPSGLSARALGPAIVVQWAPSTAGDRAVAGYRLYRATTPFVPQSMSAWLADAPGATASIYIDAAVTNGIRYYYRTAAFDALGAWSPLAFPAAHAKLGAAALVASLAVTPFQGVPGQMFSIVLSVTNTGLAFAELLLPRLEITAGAGSVTIFVGPAPSGTVSLSPGSATQFVWTATATGFGFVEFSATADGWDAGLLTGIGAADTATLLIAPLAVLSVTMTIDPPSATVYVGQWITVTLSVTNTGGLIAQNVSPAAQFVLPGGLVLQSGPLPSGPLDLAPGGATTFVWTYSVSGNGLLVFTGSVSGTDGGVGSAAAWATDSRILARPGRLAAHLAVTPGTAPTGVTLTVRATITNTGDELVTGTWLPDFSWTTTGDLALSMLTGALPAGPLTLAGQTTTVFTWTFTTSGGGSVTFTGTAYGQDASIFAFSRTVTLARQACVIPLGVLTGRLRATPAVVTEGGIIRVVFTVSNSGANPVWSATAAGAPAVSSTLLAVQVSGPVPPVDPLIGACPVANCIVDRDNCPQTKFTWEFRAVGSGTVSFSASVFWTEPVFGVPMLLADASNTVFIMPAPRLVASASVDPPTVRYGRPVTFRLTVTNTGGSSVWNLAPALVPPDPRLMRVDLAPSSAGATLANGASITWTWNLTALDGGVVALNASVAGIFDSLSGTVATTPVASASAGASVTITPRPEGEFVVFPHPVTGDRASVYLHLTEDAAEVQLEAWDTSMHRVYSGEWRAVSWLDGILTLEGLTRWAPGIYLVRARATFADGTVKAFPVFKLVIKP